MWRLFPPLGVRWKKTPAAGSAVMNAARATVHCIDMDTNMAPIMCRNKTPTRIRSPDQLQE